jgi:predicted membrane-bound spermidine synthase
MRRYLYFTVFISGMVSLAAEFVASRLLGNVFGTSNLVWAAVIGLILVYLTIGYFLGGRWADKSPKFTTLYGILAWAAFTLGVVPFIAKPVLRLAADAFDGLQVGILAGAFVGVLVLFSIPVTLMGMASPFAIRLSMQDARRAGNVSGNIYAISTLGSFVGTYLPTLLLIPTIGTTKTFLVFSGLLLLVALVGLGLSAGWKKAMPYSALVLLLAGAAVLGSPGGIKASARQVYEGESAYNYIQVVLDQRGWYNLRLNEGQGIHSVYAPDTLEYGGPWQQFLVGPFFNPGKMPQDVRRMAIVGLAAGTTARQAAAVFPNVIIDGFEIDPAIAAVGRKYFGMNLPNLNVIIQDGRYGLAHSPHKYDLIGVDAYRPPYIPWHMTTQEFFGIVAAHLEPDGVLVVNVGNAPGDRRLIDGLATTIRTVFPSVYVMDIPDTFNSMIYATLQPTEAASLGRNLIALELQGGAHPLLIHSMTLAWANLQPPPATTIIFTDDLAPIEWITNNMVLNFILHGGVETLQ